MRKVIDLQMEFWKKDIANIEFDLQSRDEIPKLLMGLQYIYRTSWLRQKVFKVLKQIVPKKSHESGRPGMDLWKIPKAVAAEITSYLAVRRMLWGTDANAYLLAISKEKPFYDEFIRRRFHQAVGDIGLKCPRQTIGNTNIGAPTPHCLRHSFAVNTLKRIKDQGKSPQHALPVLAAYLGHSEYKHTAKYLKLLDAEHRHRLVNFISTQRLNS